MNITDSFWKRSPNSGAASRRPNCGTESPERKPRPEPQSATPGHSPSQKAVAPLPAYRIHRTKQLGYVRLNKRMIYLGRVNTTESFNHYRRVLGEWLATGRAPSRDKWDQASPTVAQ